MLKIQDLDLQGIKAVIFDLDGTLYDKSSLGRRLLNKQFGRVGLLSREQIARHNLRGKYFGSEEAFYDAFFNEMAKGNKLIARLSRYWYFHDFMPKMVETLRTEYQLEPWVRDLCWKLQNANIKIAVYSDYGYVEEKMEALDFIAANVDVVADAPALGGLKPAKESLEKVVEMLGVPAENCLLIGDREDTDGASARALNMRFMQVDNRVESTLPLRYNKRYRDLVVKEGVYVPDAGIDYPENDPVKRLFHAVQDREFVVDENYPFVDDRTSWKLEQKIWGYPFVLHFVVGFLNLRCKYGLRFEGREWLKKYEKELAGGAITLGNHCSPVDCPAIILAVKGKYTTKIPMFTPNFRTKNQYLMRLVGGVPIPEPEAGLSAMKKFNQAFDTFHERGYWFHIFPEAAQWQYYKPLRPFQKGAFTMSYKYNMPLVPCVVTYRKRRGLYLLTGRKEEPLFTVKIGEPIFPDTSKPRKEEVERLRNLAYERMLDLAGIVHNTWPVVPEND